MTPTMVSEMHGDPWSYRRALQRLEQESQLLGGSPIRPFGSVLVVRRLDEPRQPSSLVIPDSARAKSNYAKVLAVGPGKLTDRGERFRPDVQPGMRVWFGPESDCDYRIGDDIVVVREGDIIAVDAAGGPRPLGDVLLVRKDEDEEKIGAIWIPESARKKATTGRVMFSGPGRRLKNGKRAAMRVAAGDRVWFHAWNHQTETLNGAEYVIAHERDMLAYEQA